MLGLPKQQEPPRGEPRGADDGGADGDRARRAAKEIEGPWFLGGGGAGALPGLGRRDVAADPENHQGRQDPDEEDPAIGAGREQEREEPDHERATQDADVDAGLNHGGDPRAPGLGPGFREQRRADGPLAAGAEGGDKAENHELPPRLREGTEPGADRGGDDGEGEQSGCARADRRAGRKRRRRAPSRRETRSECRRFYPSPPGRSRSKWRATSSPAGWRRACKDGAQDRRRAIPGTRGCPIFIAEARGGAAGGLARSGSRGRGAGGVRGARGGHPGQLPSKRARHVKAEQTA